MLLLRRLADEVALAALGVERVAGGGGLAGHAHVHPLHPRRLPVLVLARLAPVVVQAVTILQGEGAGVQMQGFPDIVTVT